MRRSAEPDQETTPAAGRTRLHVAEALAEGAVVELVAERAHYLRHVLRLPVGAAVAVFNDRDGEWRAVIDGYAKERVRLHLAGRRRAPGTPESDLWLLFAPVKRAALDWMIEKATELGVARLLPVLTRHTDVARVNLERLAAIATEAAEQCERLTVPSVAPPEALARVLDGWPPARPLLVCAEAGTVRPIAAVIGTMSAGSAGILIGPEGGFSGGELEELARRPFVVLVGLGPRVLRAETAAIAAVTCWQSLRGDWATGKTGCDDATGLDDAIECRPPFRSAPFPPQP